MKNFLFFSFLILISNIYCSSKDKGTNLKWFSANEFYFILPSKQEFKLDKSLKEENVNPWGFGFLSYGSEIFSKTAGIQIQTFKAKDNLLQEKNFYLFELLFGMRYLEKERKGFRFKSSLLFDLGFSGNSFFIAPILSMGVLYNKEEIFLTPKGFSLDLFYRFTDLNINDFSNTNKGKLNPNLGLKIGYVFEGFFKEIPKE